MDENQTAELRRAEKAKTESFEKWYGDPVTKLMVSLLPPLQTDQQRECFATLVRAAFDAGHNTGAGDVAMQMMKGVIQSRMDSEARRGR